MCPLTRCPPSSSPILSARSRLTRVPLFQRPTVVTLSVSAAASTENLFAPVATAVMQTPEHETDAPIAIEAGS